MPLFVVPPTVPAGARRLLVPETVRPAGWPSHIGDACRRADGNLLQGVHADPATSALAASVLARVPELASWDEWYAHPPVLSNGHVHTIVAAKLRSTRAVRYYRQLIPTPDGGTLAVDLLTGIRRQRSSAAGPEPGRAAGLRSLLRGGTVAGASEDSEGVDTLFVGTPPPLAPDRPLLLLASGLGGGSQDTYVRSMAATAAERGWQVAVINMRSCGGSPVTSPRLFSAYRGANDDVRTAVTWLRRHRLPGASPGLIAGLGWSNSGTILNNVYDRNLGKSLRTLWASARDQYMDASTGHVRPVPRWDGGGDFYADDTMARTAKSIRELDEAVTRRQYGYDSVDDYYAAASSDQRLASINTPLLLLNAYDDPIVPGVSLRRAVEAARANHQILFALTSHGGHLGWCERGGEAGGLLGPWAGPAWVERVACGFLETALGVEPTEGCEQGACEIFD